MRASPRLIKPKMSVYPGRGIGSQSFSQAAADALTAKRHGRM
jgi:hypothetical protein